MAVPVLGQNLLLWSTGVRDWEWSILKWYAYQCSILLQYSLDVNDCL
jgi:hypothetical protein